MYTKMYYAPIVIFISSLAACISPPIQSTVSAESTSISQLGFVEPDPEMFSKISPPLVEYFYHKKQAMIAGNPEILWSHYPDLQRNTNIQNGINIEGWLIENYRSLTLIDGNIMLEYYERLKVRKNDGQIEVFIHGMELYTFVSEGGFQESGGEFKLFITFTEKDEKLTVIKTDEVTMSEWQHIIP